MLAKTEKISGRYFLLDRTLKAHFQYFFCSVKVKNQTDVDWCGKQQVALGAHVACCLYSFDIFALKMECLKDLALVSGPLVDKDYAWCNGGSFSAVTGPPVHLTGTSRPTHDISFLSVGTPLSHRARCLSRPYGN